MKMLDRRPAVSVLIACHNYAAFLPDALDSVLQQDYPGPVDIVVVDDGSRDETPAVLGAYVERIRSLRQDNRGQAAALNAAYARATGEILCFLDADDRWGPDKVRKVVEAFGSDSCLGLVHHALATVGPDGEPVESEVLSRWDLADGDVRRLMRETVLQWRFMPTSGLSITRDVARWLFPLPETLKSSADEFIAPIAALLAPVRYVPEAIGFYRLHGANVWACGAFSGAMGEVERQRGAARRARLIEEKVAHANEVLRRVGSARRLSPWILWWYLHCKALAQGRRPIVYLWPALCALAASGDLSPGEKARRMRNFLKKAVKKSIKRASTAGSPGS